VVFVWSALRARHLQGDNKTGERMMPFKVQILTSPGIRKSENEFKEQELGEDAVGFIANEKVIALWIADGAPGNMLYLDGLKLDSRILAKIIGESFESVALNSNYSSSEDIEFEFKRQLESKLNNKLDEIVKKYKDMGRKVEEILEPRIFRGDKSYFMKWSASFLGVILLSEIKEARIFRLGDCSGFLSKILSEKRLPSLIDTVNTTTIMTIVGDTSERLFLNVETSKSWDELSISFVHKPPTFERISDCFSVILMSDGLMSEKDTKLLPMDGTMDHLWEKITSINKKTDDDKTAIFFSFLKEE